MLNDSLLCQVFQIWTEDSFHSSLTWCLYLCTTQVHKYLLKKLQLCSTTLCYQERALPICLPHLSFLFVLNFLWTHRFVHLEAKLSPQHRNSTTNQLLFLKYFDRLFWVSSQFHHQVDLFWWTKIHSSHFL